MRTTAVVLQNLIRLLGVVLLVLGFLFWFGQSRQLIPIHMALGMLLVLVLWALAIVALAARIKAGMAFGAMVYGLIVIYFGITMGRLLPGHAHEAIRVIHFLLGVGAIGLGEMLGARIKRATA